MDMNAISSHYVLIDNKQIHYLCSGDSDRVILLLHGWPTCSYLWRNIMPLLARTHKVIAIDLPGFGKSDKSLDVKYTYEYHIDILNRFLEELQIKNVALGVHDLGGPIGLTWMVRNLDKVNSLILFNTLVYTKFSWAVALFFISTYTPFVKKWITSKRGISFGMKFGVQNKENISKEVLQNYQAPFETEQARKALLKTIHDLSPGQFTEVQKAMPSLKIPVCGIYGANDRILPDIKRTMDQVKQDVPHAEIHQLANCGHFLQEDEPVTIANHIYSFLERFDV